MDSPYVVWAWCKGLLHLSADEETKLKQYFSSSISGGGDLSAFEKEELSDGILLRIAYKDIHVVGQVLEKAHNLGTVIGSNAASINSDYYLFVTNSRKDLALGSNQIVDSDDENTRSFEVVGSVKSRSGAIPSQQNYLSKLDLTGSVKHDAGSIKETVIVEVYEFPNKPLDELYDELPYHFSLSPFNAITFTSGPDMYDTKSRTFKLEFSASDAEKIIEVEEQYLFGEESGKLRLRRFEPHKSCAVLLSCDVKLASEKVIQNAMREFGDVKDLRKMGDSCQKYLIIFHQHESASKAAKACTFRITDKIVTLSIWNEPLEKSGHAESPYVPEMRTKTVLVSCGGTTSLKVVETAMKAFGKISKCRKYKEPDTFLVEFVQSSDAYKAAADEIVTSGNKSLRVILHEENSSKTVVVEVFKFPDKQREVLLEELIYHFSIAPFKATSLTDPRDMYDGKSKTFKLEFVESDAEKIIANEEQYLLAEETERIRVRRFEPPKPCAVLLTCEVKIASEKIIRTAMKTFGAVKDVTEMDNTALKYLVVFHQPEDASKAADAGNVMIAGKQVKLTIWDEPVESSVSATTPAVSMTPAVPDIRIGKVLVSCEENTSIEVVESALENFGEIAKCTNAKEPKTFLVEFVRPSDAYKAAAVRTIKYGKLTLSIILNEESFPKYNTYDVTSEVEGGGKTSSSKMSEGRLAKAVLEKQPMDIATNDEETGSFVFLVSNLADVDNQLLAHWIKTVTGVWPLSCHMNDAKNKAIVKMPSTMDISLFRKASEEEYFLHGSLLSVSKLQPTAKILAEFDRSFQHEQQNVIKLYFNNTTCGLRNGHITAIEPHGHGQKAFIITYSTHKAIPDIIGKVSHMSMGYKIDVGEFYSAAGSCRLGDLFTFSPRKHQSLPTKHSSKIIVKNVSYSEQKHFELLMKHPKNSGGDRSATITYGDNVAYVCYEDEKITISVFEKSRGDGIFLNDKRLEMDLETTELKSCHDHKAIRLSGLPHYIDPDRLKFFLSDISENLVTSFSFQENGDRAVAYFKNNLDMPLLYSNYQAIKLQGCEEMRIHPELKSTTIMVSALSPDINQSCLEMMIDSVLQPGHSAHVKPSNDVKSAWIISVRHEDIEFLSKELSKDKDIRVSHHSEFLGGNVTNGMHRKTCHLSHMVNDSFLLQFLLDQQLPGFKKLSGFVQQYDGKLSDDGTITMQIDSHQYTESITKWIELQDTCGKEVANTWCVATSPPFSEEMSDEVSSLMLSYKHRLKVDSSGEFMVIAGEKQLVKESVSTIARVIKEKEEKQKEERESRKEVMQLQDYEVAYLNLIDTLTELKNEYPVKELFFDFNHSCLVIHANNQYIDVIRKTVAGITSKICELSVSKSDSFVKQCENHSTKEKIIENLKANNLLAVCVPDRKKLTAYAKTRDIAQKALQCIDEVVWEFIYPVGRAFSEEEQRLLQHSKRLWEKAKDEIVKKNSSVNIIENLDDTSFVVTGTGRGNQNIVLKEIDEFFSKSLPKSRTFAGNPFHTKYIIRYMGSELKVIQTETKAKVTIVNEEISLSGTTEQTNKAEQQLQALHDSIQSGNHKVELEYHIQILLNEPEIIEDLGRATQTLIILENGDKLRKRAPHSSKPHNNLLLQISITKKTTLQVKKAEIHEIHDCDGLVIPTSRNLKLSELNPSFASYIKEKGGNEIFNECINSPGKKLLPGSILTTSAGEFRELKRIIHMVLVEWSRSEAVNVLEKSLKSTFKSATEAGVMALLLPMPSFPEDYDNSLLITSIIKTIKVMGDGLPPRVVLLETQSDKLKHLTFSLNEEFQSVKNYHEPVPRMSIPASRSTSGFDPPNKAPQSTVGSQPSKHRLTKLRNDQLLVGGCKFTVMKGLLEESKQRAIVNSTGENISLQDNPLAKALDKAAGPKLQEECTKLAPLSEGKVKVSKAYKLQSESILHCRINGNYLNKQSEKDLTALIIECLRIVDQSLKYPSIAFPALGTGNLKYPASVVASCLIEGLTEYTSKYGIKNLEEVVAVIFPGDANTYEDFLGCIDRFSGAAQDLSVPISHHDSNPKKQNAIKETPVTDELSLSLKDTKITVQQGNLLVYTGKAIVCPANKDLSLAGKIAEILNKDPYIKRKLANADAEEMASHGVCMVKTNPTKVKLNDFNAEYIILVDSNSNLDSVVKRCLEKCQKKKIESIALPFIGAVRASQGIPAEKIVKMLLTAAVEFVKIGSGVVKAIDFIIFGEEPFKLFEAALIALKEEPTFMGYVKGAIKYFFTPNKSEALHAPPTSKPPSEDSKTLFMTIYGVEEAGILSAKKKLNDRLQKESVVIQWDDLDSYEDDKHLIACLSDDQINYLYEAAECMDVELVLDQETKNIQISGYKNTIYDYREIIKSEFRKIEKNNLDKKFGEFDASNIIWTFRDEREEEWSEFDWEDSHFIELRFSQNPNEVITLMSKVFSASLKIDLHHKSFKHQTKIYKIRRNDKRSGFPKEWDDNAGVQAEVPLDKTSKEYQVVQANFMKTIQSKSAVILEIRRVQHVTAYNQYLNQRRYVASKLNKREEEVERVPLWHGSQEGVISKIAKSFFNRSYSGANATVYGKGSYFACEASYSARDTYSKPNAAGEKYMFQARVIVGEYALGNSEMFDCPNKQDGSSYDSVVDNLQNPTMYIVFQDAAAYPEYIIKFRM